MRAPLPAGVAEAGDLAAIHARSFADGWQPAAMASLLASPGCFALWFPGRGFILLRMILDEAEIITLAVMPQHRRQGLGAALLAAAAAHCLAAGGRFLHLEVAAGNAAACGLYSALGFRQVGQRPRYYPDGTTALLLRLNLGEAAAAPAPG